ncbi:MAG: glycosyltransferase family 2 protein [Pseudomonadota bacterium]
MQLKEITPLVLTYNEQDNLERTLVALNWAARIVIVDSGSTDKTLEILRRFDQVEVYGRSFDNFAAQRNFGLEQISTPWVLSLDADHVISPGTREEIARLDPASDVSFAAPFRYLVWGRAVRCAILPPRPVLFRLEGARYEPDGHAERLRVNGPQGRLTQAIAHDDRKPLARWVASQDRYAREEAHKLLTAPGLSKADWVRRHIPFAPLLVFFHVLLLRGGIFDGRRGWFYAWQRLLAEVNLALHLLDRRGSGAGS